MGLDLLNYIGDFRKYATIMNRLKIKVPYVDLSIKRGSYFYDAVMNAFSDILESGHYVMGVRLDSFEKKIADFVECSYAVGVNSGTDAIFFALLSMDVGIGDEVILPGNIFPAVANAVYNTGAQPVFCDVNYEDMLIDPVKIPELITSRTKAILPVHLTGMPCDMDAIKEIATCCGVKVIEDAAQAIGARYKQKPAGSLAAVGCFSLHPLKNVHAFGDGGVVVTNDRDVFEKVLNLRNHGLLNDVVHTPGYNSRLDEIHAAVAEIQLADIENNMLRRRTIVERYQAGLEELVNVNIESGDKQGAYQLYMIKTKQRDALSEYLLEKGIETRIHYRSYVPFHTFYRSMHRTDLAVTRRLSDEVLSLPIYPSLTDTQIDFIIECIRDFFRQ